MPEAAVRPFRLGALILAAGESRRMGSPKQLLEIEGRSLIARAVQAALDAGAHPVVVALGAHAEPVRAAVEGRDVLFADNPEWRSGLASSIRVGVTALLAANDTLDAILVTPCDQPAFCADTIDRLVAAHRARGQIAAARYRGRIGAPAVFGRTHFETLTRVTGDEGARRLLNSPGAQVEALELPELAFDLDTPADWTAWNRLGA